MALVVQKFGGTSVADPQKIKAAAQKAMARHAAGDQVVVVVSAMGHQTDILVDLAKQITDRPSAREMDMLRLFLEHPGDVISRDRFLQEVWGYERSPVTRTVDMHVRKLREKLELDPAEPRHFHTVHGAGYRFDP